jgi:hypothetical protein
MSSIDSWWLSFWSYCATFGFILVILGCIIEGVEHFVKFKRSESHKRKGIEKLGWLILVGGLAMEFLGDKRARRITDRENRRLTVEAAQALKDAGKANERSRLLESTNIILGTKLEELRSTNLMLQADVLKLKAEAQPRYIAKQKRDEFIQFLDGTPKGPVMLGSRHPNWETIDFSNQVESLLTEAGFTVSSKMNYQENTTWFPAGITIGLFIDSPTNKPIYYETLFHAFNQIGVVTVGVTNGPAMRANDGRVGPNEIMVFIIEKQ